MSFLPPLGLLFSFAGAVPFAPRDVLGCRVPRLEIEWQAVFRPKVLSLPMCISAVLGVPYMANGKEGKEKDVEFVKDHNAISRMKFGEREEVGRHPFIHPSIPPCHR